jgi:hypothetical protein
MIYVQKFKIVIDKEDKCKNMRQRNVATKYNINNTSELWSELNTYFTS